MMMPEHYHPSDKDWILHRLQSLPTAPLRRKASSGYSAAYQAAHDAEPCEHKKNEAARRAANLRLRRFVSRVFEVN